MASLAELHTRWTFSQFTEFLRAAMIARLPDAVADPASWQDGRNRWKFLEEELAAEAGVSREMPVILEEDPFVDQLDPRKLRVLLQRVLGQGLQDSTIQALVDLGRKREQAVLMRLQERYQRGLPELEREIDDAEATAPRSGASV